MSHARRDVDRLVFVIDDDATVRAALEGLLRSAGLVVRSFDSAAAVLASLPENADVCLVIDVHLPDGSGLDLQAELVRRGLDLSIVFITGQGDIPMSVRAIKAGAVEFLPKPFRDQDILAAIDQGLTRARHLREEIAERTQSMLAFQSLTPRQRQVMQCVVSGLLNKQIAYELGISEVTVKIHRGHVMAKMAADSVPELVRMSERISRSPAWAK
jgi:FixJ family two-component response regulator